MKLFRITKWRQRILWKQNLLPSESKFSREMYPTKKHNKESQWDNLTCRQDVTARRISYLYYGLSLVSLLKRFLVSRALRNLLAHLFLLQKWPCKRPWQRKIPFARRRMNELGNLALIYFVQTSRWLVVVKIPTLLPSCWQQIVASCLQHVHEKKKTKFHG